MWKGQINALQGLWGRKAAGPFWPCFCICPGLWWGYLWDIYRVNTKFGKKMISVSVLHTLGTFYNIHLNSTQLYLQANLRLLFQTTQRVNVTVFNHVLSCMIVCLTSFMHLCFMYILSCLFACSFWSSSAPFFFFTHFICIMSYCLLSVFIFMYPHCDYVHCSFGACAQWLFRDWNEGWMNECMNHSQSQNQR